MPEYKNPGTHANWCSACRALCEKEKRKTAYLIEKMAQKTKKYMAMLHIVLMNGTMGSPMSAPSKAQFIQLVRLRLSSAEGQVQSKERLATTLVANFAYRAGN
jgi:hypothetical protein